MRLSISVFCLSVLSFTACQQFDALPNTAPQTLPTPISSAAVTATRHEVKSLAPEADALLQIQRVNNTFCAPSVSEGSYLPNVTYVLTRTGKLKFGTGTSVSVEASGGALSEVSLTEAEFTSLKQTLTEVQGLLAQHAPPAFSVQSPVLNPPTYAVGSCAIFEAFDFGEEDGAFQRYDRPDFELYEAPTSVYAPAYIAALDRLKAELLALKQKYQAA